MIPDYGQCLLAENFCNSYWTSTQQTEVSAVVSRGITLPFTLNSSVFQGYFLLVDHKQLTCQPSCQDPGRVEHVLDGSHACTD